MTKDSFAYSLWVGIVWFIAVSPVALGQAYDEDQTLEASEEGMSNGNSEVDDDNRIVSNPSAPTQTQKEHRVVSGDTLWDLCAAYLNNPWYWPRVWSYNPDLTNPHWIYPGQVIKFFPSGELPSEMLVSDEIEIPESVPELPEDELPEDLVRFAEGRDIVRVKKVNAIDINRDSFVTEDELEGVGTLRGSKEEKENLSQYDSVYLEFDDTNPAQVGQNWLVVRTMKEINHPLSGDFIGYHTQVQGIAHVLKVDGKIATAIITSSFNPILRGDKVIPWKEDINKRIIPKPNTTQVMGSIVDAKISMTNYGERHVVFIDRGTSHGVQDGNIFDCVRKQDGLMPMGEDFDSTIWEEELPVEIYGRVMVVDARATASTGVVVSALRELHAGDRVLMTVQ